MEFYYSLFNLQQQHMLTSQTDTLVDIQFTPQIVSNATITQDNGEPKMVAVKV